MNRRVALALIVGIALLAPYAAYAESGKLIGTVTAVDPGAGTVSVAESNGARAMEFRIDDKSRITIRASRKSLKLADVAVGSAVSVTYATGDENELPIVSHMQVSAPEKSAAE